jgi:hypothetical protein
MPRGRGASPVPRPPALSRFASKEQSDLPARPHPRPPSTISSRELAFNKHRHLLPRGSSRINQREHVAAGVRKGRSPSAGFWVPMLPFCPQSGSRRFRPGLDHVETFGGNVRDSQI